MTPTEIHKLKKKYKANDNDVMSCILYAVTGSKQYSYINGVGRDSKAKASSMGVISGRYFNDTNMLALIDEIQETLNTGKVSTVPEKEKESKINNNKPHLTLSPNMTNAELVTYFTDRMNSITDKNKQMDYELKLLDKLDIKAVQDKSNELKPLIYLPQRCNDCEHYKP
jgi:hypothetical protein